MREKVLKRLLILLFLAVLLCLYAVIYIIPGILSVFTKTVTAEYGTLRMEDEVTCYLIADETVYTAGSAGQINYYQADGTQVRKGISILQVLAQDTGDYQGGYADVITRLAGDSVSLTAYTAEFSGKLCYRVDGYENYFTPETMKALKYEEVRKLKIEPISLVREAALAGEPLYKICDTDRWYMAAWVKGGDISKYEAGAGVTVELPKGDIKATVSEIIADGDQWLVLLESDRYYENIGFVREEEAIIVTADATGIILDNENITAVDGQVGVYVKQTGGSFKFVPIKVITASGGKSVVEQDTFTDEEGNKVYTIENYDEILREP